MPVTSGAVKLLLLDDADFDLESAAASSRRKNSALTLAGSRAPVFAGKLPDPAAAPIAGGPSGGGVNLIVVPSASTAEYWYSISGSQLSPLSHGHRSVGMDLESLPPVEEWDEVEPQQQQGLGISRQEQRIGVGLFEFCVVSRSDQLGDPALDEDPDVRRIHRRPSHVRVDRRRSTAIEAAIPPSVRIPPKSTSPNWFGIRTRRAGGSAPSVRTSVRQAVVPCTRC